MLGSTSPRSVGKRIASKTSLAIPVSLFLVTSLAAFAEAGKNNKPPKGGEDPQELPMEGGVCLVNAPSAECRAGVCTVNGDLFDGGVCAVNVGDCLNGSCTVNAGVCGGGFCVVNVGVCQNGSCNVNAGYCGGGYCVVNGPGANCRAGSCTVNLASCERGSYCVVNTGGRCQGVLP